MHKFIQLRQSQPPFRPPRAMSQHRYYARDPEGRLVEVLTGYDPPLGQCFLVVCRCQEEPPHDDVETLWSNLDHERWPMSVGRVRVRLRRLGLPAPHEVIQAVRRDELGHADRSRQVTYNDPSDPLEL